MIRFTRDQLRSAHAVQGASTDQVNALAGRPRAPKAKKTRRKPETPRSRVKNALRNLWLRSRERATALKHTGYCCSCCGVKQSAAQGREVKIEVHHVDGINWDGLVDLVFERMLPDPSRLEPLCKTCHEKRHGELDGAIVEVEEIGA
jgi:predicted HNH restriction endonuclease